MKRCHILQLKPIEIIQFYAHPVYHQRRKTVADSAYRVSEQTEVLRLGCCLCTCVCPVFCSQPQHDGDWNVLQQHPVVDSKQTATR